MTAAAPMRVGVDIGGTFTDLVFLRPDGRLDKVKVSSTPAEYSRAIVDGILAYCSQAALKREEISEVAHATTVATNAILERKGARTALLTTDGFRDVLELRRIRIPLSYDLDWQKPEPMVERALRFPIRERLDSQGHAILPLDVPSLEQVIVEIEAADVEAIAVCFLHAYRNETHERQVGEILRRRFPDKHVSLSSEVLPEMLEFERTSTTVLNAYVAPLVSRYLNRLRARLAEERVRAPILVMQSNGGLISAPVAAQRPVIIIESGPAAGVIAAARVAHEGGHPNVITLDMGGTTTKASIIERGAFLRGSEYEVGSPVSASSRLSRGNGYLLRIPVIDISEVGAGGGSLAMIDPGGSLRVGPRSAGAVPGPACYGQGNHSPTVTDANLVLGYINPDSLAGGALRVDRALAETAIQDQVAKPSGLSMLDAAHGIHLIANSNMVRAIKSVSVERGRDPKEFIMMAFGGAGPIHAAGVARALGMRRILIPPAPGVFSALGLLRAEIEHHAARTVLVSTRGGDLAQVQATVDTMHDELKTKIREEGYPSDAIKISAAGDLRYRGQSSEITVSLGSTRIDEAALREAEDRFETEFERTYGYRGDRKEFELVTFRLVATVVRGVEHGTDWMPEQVVQRKESESRKVYFGPEVGMCDTPVHARASLGITSRSGPLLIQEYDTTIVVPPDCCAMRDALGNVVVDVAG
jgi:N-methylhydantoinase A